MGKALCTVLIPFDARGQSRFATLKEIGEELGFETLRVAQYYSSGMILEEIVRSIWDARLIVADLTDVNRNVCYELGIAHALGKRVFLTAEDPAAVSIDFGDLEVCRLEPTPAGRDRWLTALRGFMDTPGALSPIRVFTGGSAVAGQRWIARRIGGFVVDLALAYLPVVPLLAVGALDSASPDAVWSVTVSAVVLAYFVLLSLLLGTTPGQRLFGLQVIALDRSSPSAWQRLLRPIAALLNFATLGIGFFWVAKPPRHQAVQDLLTRTLVIRRRRARPSRDPATEKRG